MDFNYITAKMNEEIKCAEEFEMKFKLMCHALGVLPTDDEGKFKTIEQYLDDIAFAYLQYERKFN